MFKQRREYLFLYTVKDANPNGDPLNENHPRYDEDTDQVIVSDVRIKRTIRDEWVRQGLNVFIDGEPKTLKTRFEELKQKIGKTRGEDIAKECIDLRLFGVTFALGDESFSWTGPVQFKWGRSLHAVNFDLIQGTAAFANETKSGEDKKQRSFRNEYKVPFALIAVSGIANQYTSKYTGATDQDLQALFNGLWQGTNNLITRSKNEHKARLFVEIKYKEDFTGKIGGLDEKIKLLTNTGMSLTPDEQKRIRSLEEVMIDPCVFVNAVKRLNDTIDRIKIIKDKELTIKGQEELSELSFVEIEER